MAVRRETGEYETKAERAAISADALAQLSEASFVSVETLAMNAYQVPLVRNLMKRLLTRLTV